MAVIFNPYYLILGNLYNIEHPCYDDYDEGLKPEIEIVKIINQDKFGFLVLNIENNNEYHLKFSDLFNCKIHDHV